MKQCCCVPRDDTFVIIKGPHVDMYYANHCKAKMWLWIWACFERFLEAACLPKSLKFLNRI